MGRIVHVSGQINKHQSLADYSRIVQLSVLNLMQSLNGFAEDKSLAGKGYDSAKDYINSAHIPICQALYAALASEISANISVVSACGGLAGSDLIVEDELVTEKVYLAKEIERYEIAKQNVSFADTGLLQIYEEKIQSNKERIKEIDTELENLNTYDTKTQELHKNPFSELESVSNAISSISKGVSFGEGQFVVSKINMEWVNQYIENFSVAETEIKLNDILPQTEIKFKALMHQQFGFDLLTSDIIFDLHKKIEKKYPDIDQTERDYMFARVLSQFSYSSENDPFNGAYEAGAGSINNYDTLGFFEELEISEQDYNYLRYNIRLQNFISSEHPYYSIDAIKKAVEENGMLEPYANSMITGLNLPEDTVFSDDEYLAKYKEIHEQYSERTDFAHMMYTISANIIEEEKIKDTYEAFLVKEIIQTNVFLWKNSEERKAYTGWLGDATWPGFEDDTNKLEMGIALFFLPSDYSRYHGLSHRLNPDVSFNNSDYMADLDAVNISNRLNDKNNLVGTITKYYENMQNDGNRAEEFLTNIKLDSVKSMIFDVSGVQNMEELEAKWPTSALFIKSLSENSNVMLEVENEIEAQ